MSAWGDGRISDDLIALFRVKAAKQMHNWQIVATVKPVQVLNGSLFGTPVSTSTYVFTLFRSNVTASVPLSYVFF